jgi:hypothetical protein
MMDELLARVKVRLRITGEVEDSMLTELLTSALDVINDIRQYTPTAEAIVEPQYESIAVEMTVALYSKLGAEGEVSHSENGISRVYDSSSFPASLLARIIPRPRI